MNKEFSELEIDLIKLSRMRYRDKDLENIRNVEMRMRRYNTCLMGILPGEKENKKIMER